MTATLLPRAAALTSVRKLVDTASTVVVSIIPPVEMAAVRRNSRCGREAADGTNGRVERSST